MESTFKFVVGSVDELNEFVEDLNVVLREVQGPFYNTSASPTIVTLTGHPSNEYVATSRDRVIYASYSGSPSPTPAVRLPSAVDAQSRLYVVKNANPSAGALDLKCVTGEQIDGTVSATISLAPLKSRILAPYHSGGYTGWWIAGGVM